MDPSVNPNGKVVIGVTGQPTSKFIKMSIEEAGELVTSDTNLLLELI